MIVQNSNLVEKYDIFTNPEPFMCENKIKKHVYDFGQQLQNILAGQVEDLLLCTHNLVLSFSSILPAN